MDCVGCDKCRLWGKVQIAGYGAALKVLFEFDENKNGQNPHPRRTERVTLINTLGRISDSLTAIPKFRIAVNTGDESVLGIEGTLPLSAKEAEATWLAEPSAADEEPRSADFDDFEGGCGMTGLVCWFRRGPRVYIFQPGMSYR
jgi:hypothetical protein